MRASVIVVSWNGRELLQGLVPALSKVERPEGTDLEVVVVDNGSTDGSADYLSRTHPEVVRVCNRTNAGFARGVNDGARAATGDVLLILNNDAVPSERWLSEMVAPIAAGQAEVVGGRILDWEGRSLHFGEGVLTFDGHAFQRDLGVSAERGAPEEPRRSLFACGGNMAVRRDLYLELGGFDDDFFAYFEDVDFGWRCCLAGHRVLLVPGGVVRHRGAATSNRLDPFDRGFLFEVNAFQTAVKNLGDDELRGYLPAILLTLLSRLQSLTVRLADPEGKLRDYPFSPEGYRRSRQAGFLDRLFGRGGGMELSHPHSLSYARSVEYILTHLDRILEKRERVQAMRRVPDAEVLKLIEIAAVPTYPGDRELFASAFFRHILPRRVAVRALEEIQKGSIY